MRKRIHMRRIPTAATQNEDHNLSHPPNTTPATQNEEFLRHQFLTKQALTDQSLTVRGCICERMYFV